MVAQLSHRRDELLAGAVREQGHADVADAVVAQRHVAHAVHLDDLALQGEGHLPRRFAALHRHRHLRAGLSAQTADEFV